MEQKCDLESILNEVGYVGRTQILYFALILFIVFYASMQTLGYAFTAGDLNYRCHIAECDNADAIYNPGWLQYAVPFDNNTGLPEKCSKYIFIGANSSDAVCMASDFDNRVKIKCDKFVFENDEQTILNEFDLTCNENKWKLALPGTVHNTGTLLNLLIIGYISDRFGRKIVLVCSPIFAAVIGILEPFAWNYSSYVVLKFIETVFGGGIYAISTVLSIELVDSPHRTLVGTLILLFGSLGKVFLGFTAMLIQNWKIQTFVNCIPLLVAIAYIWVIPESYKWLQVNGRYKDIADILLRTIKWNNVSISPEVKEILTNQPELMAADTQENNEKDRYPIWEVFKSPPMLLRILMLSFCWITNIFIFYGLTLISVSIGGNKYTNFMIVNLVEIPACIVIVICRRFGRKLIICPSLILSGASLLIYPFVADWYWIKLIVFMIGKFTISIAFGIFYIFTSELVPTNLRQTLFGVCSGFGRIGSILAPQAPLLELVMTNLPIFVFGGTAFAAGLLSLQFPETVDTKLPATIDEALRIGKKLPDTSSKLELL